MLEELGILFAGILHLTRSYTHRGCYADAKDRAVRYYQGDYSYTAQCNYKCYQGGYYYFGFQYHVQCWCDHNNWGQVTKHGPATGCVNGKGNAWMFDLYQVSSMSSPCNLYIYTANNFLGGIVKILCITTHKTQNLRQSIYTVWSYGPINWQRLLEI